MSVHPVFSACASRLRLSAAAFACVSLLAACAQLPAPQERTEPVTPGVPEQKSKSQPIIRSNGGTAVGALSGDSFRLLVWNVQKAGSDQWIGDFRTLSAGSDLVLLQEAKLHDEFSHGIASLPRWDMVQAWQWRNQPTGVLTASEAPPLSVRALEHREPMLRTDKSALITEYRIAGSEQTLMVANIHAINFTVDTRAFREQLIAVADLLDEHEGPVIFSGDLNTWRGERAQIVADIADALGLQTVAFTGPRRHFRQFPLDHVYYRDLELIEADVTEVDSSDHNPLHATFRFPRADHASAQSAALAPTAANGGY